MQSAWVAQKNRRGDGNALVMSWTRIPRSRSIGTRDGRTGTCRDGSAARKRATEQGVAVCWQLSTRRSARGLERRGEEFFSRGRRDDGPTSTETRSSFSWLQDRDEQSLEAAVRMDSGCDVWRQRRLTTHARRQRKRKEAGRTSCRAKRAERKRRRAPRRGERGGLAASAAMPLCVVGLG